MMIVRRCCSWCHETVTINGPTLCPTCGHRADVARMDCDCGMCQRFEVPTDADGIEITVGCRVNFDEPYQGIKGGYVVEFIRGVMGPIAAVYIGESRKVDTLCRRLRVMLPA